MALGTCVGLFQLINILTLITRIPILLVNIPTLLVKTCRERYVVDRDPSALFLFTEPCYDLSGFFEDGEHISGLRALLI